MNRSTAVALISVCFFAGWSGRLLAQNNETKPIRSVVEQCIADNARSCADAARRLETENGNFKGAFDFHRRACELKISTSCSEAIRLYRAKKLPTPPAEQLVGILLRTCNNGNARDCRELADFYNIGLGVPENPKTALSLYDRSCKLGDEYACFIRDQAKSMSSANTQQPEPVPRSAGTAVLPSGRVAARVDSQTRPARQASSCPDYRNLLKITSAAVDQLTPSEGRTIKGGPIASASSSWSYNYRDVLMPPLACEFGTLSARRGIFRTVCTIGVNSDEAVRLEGFHEQCLATVGVKRRWLGWDLPGGKVIVTRSEKQFSIELSVRGDAWKADRP